MGRTAFILFGIISFVLIIALSSPYGFVIDVSTEDAILKGNWNKVIESLEKDDSKANDPIARLIMGHACLATNRNNASTLLFLSVKEERDLKLWSQWTESLLRKHPHNPVALYLSADAKARRGKHKEAIQELSRAIKIKEDLALAYNARGVLLLLNNEQDAALIDFYTATKIAPNLADTHANLGSYWVIAESSDGALEAFNKAINLNPEFGLAYNGRGCGFFGRGEFEKAARDFTIASQLFPILAVTYVNQGFTSAYASRLITTASMVRKPGATIESINQQYSTVLKEQKQQLLDALPSKSDLKFWNKIDVLPILSQDQVAPLIKEYGLQKVQVGTLTKIQELKEQITQDLKHRVPLPEKMGFSDSLSSFSFFSSAPMEGRGNWISFLTPKSVDKASDKISSGLFKMTAGSGKDVVIYVTDFGINQWKQELKTGDDFHKADNKAFPNLPRSGQVLVVMEPDQDFRTVSKEQLTQTIFSKLKARVDGGLAVGNSVFEIQLIQHIKTEGYLFPWFDERQKMVNDFGECAYKAIGMLNNYLIAKGVNVENNCFLGSNGVKVFSESVASWRPYVNVINSVTGFDGRAFLNPMREAIKTAGPEKFRLYATRGDWPGENIPIAHSIANLDVLKMLKNENPALTVGLLDPRDRPNLPPWSHISGMDPGGKFLVRYLNVDNSFTTSKEVTGENLRPKSSQGQPIMRSLSLNASSLGLFSEKLNRIAEVSKSTSTISSNFTQIPGYYTSIDRPLTEVGALASMVDKGIKPTLDSVRSALIVAQDPFRANLLQSELSRYGFQTKVIPPTTDPQKEARLWGADVILGIKGTIEMKTPQMGYNPTMDSSKKYYDQDIGKKFPPPFPPDKGGGAAGIPQKSQPIIPQDWNWGKPFAPASPKTPPGGVSTEELARSFVDKGNWPVMTSFSLFYAPSPSFEEQKK